jgi:hypothetical protein
VVQATFDTSEVTYKKMLDGVPWPRFLLSDPKMKDIITKLEVTGIPRVAVLGKGGILISMDGRKEIATMGK